MKIIRKSATSSTSTFSTKSSDADTVVRGVDGGSLDKVSWVTGDLGSTLDRASSHDKALTIVIQEAVNSLAHTKAATPSPNTFRPFECLCLGRSRSFVKVPEQFRLI